MAQSTAEAELLAYNEAYQMGEAISSLLEVLHFKTGRWLHGDSKAALALCLNESGHWRTRHLRLRATKLREALQVEKTWEAVHQEGGDLVADGLTKPLQGAAFLKFRGLLGMQGSTKATNQDEVREMVSQQEKFKTCKVVAALAIASGGIGWNVSLCAAALREHGKRGAGDGTTSWTSTRASSPSTEAVCGLRMLRVGDTEGESGDQKPIPKAVEKAQDAGTVALGVAGRGAGPYVPSDGGRPHPRQDLFEATSSSATGQSAPWEGREFQAPPRGVDQ